MHVVPKSYSTVKEHDILAISSVLHNWKNI